MPEGNGVCNELQWFVDELLYFRNMIFVKGWAYHPQQVIITVAYQLSGSPPVEVKGYGLPSPDVEQQFGANAKSSRFEFQIPTDATPHQVGQIELVFYLANGDIAIATGLVGRKIHMDAYHKLHNHFFEQVRSQQPPFKVLEIGSRSRSGNVRTSLLGKHVEYIGMDIVAGENVNLVGDAHELSSLLPPQSFDAVFSISVFEHLLMPWKVAIEINRVLKPGGLVLICTHQTFPLHEVPWDFWRFSDQSWHALFNAQTGFKVLETALGESACIVPHLLHSATATLDAQPAYLATSVLCQKVEETSVVWDVKLKDVIETIYPL